jgi:hypothetical protein
VGLRRREGRRSTASFAWSMRSSGIGTTRRKCGRSTSALGFVSSSSAASYIFPSLGPVERMKYRCKHRRLVARWRDMRLEGSKLDGLADAGALHEGRKLGLFEEMVEGSDLGCEGNLPLSS